MDAKEQELDLKVGDKLRFFYQEGNINNCLYHVRGIVDETCIVVRWWAKNKKRWEYKVMERHFIDISREHVTIEKAKRSKRP